jgi:hypothetical protein
MLSGRRRISGLEQLWGKAGAGQSSDGVENKDGDGMEYFELKIEATFETTRHAYF